MATRMELPQSLKPIAMFKMGSKGKSVKLIQELLCLHGFTIVVDGIFGLATQYAVKEFQEVNQMTVDGIVHFKTFAALRLPFENVLREIFAGGKSLPEMIVLYAEQHLKEHPREIGGQNKGPWVRFYMQGNDGQSWPWCAGFVSYILKQACKALERSLPLKTSFSCDLLASYAIEKGRFIRGIKVGNLLKVTPGCLFLTRRTPTDWVHTGIVKKIDVAGGVMVTIEGNTNDDGLLEGYEVCKRIRGFKNKDFILID